MTDSEQQSPMTETLPTIQDHVRVRYRFGEQEMEAEGPTTFVNQHTALFLQTMRAVVKGDGLSTLSDSGVQLIQAGQPPAAPDEPSTRYEPSAEPVEAGTTGSQQPGPYVDPLAVPETFAEWGARHQLDSHVDKAVAAAVYLYECKRAMEFSTSHIERMYEKAHWDKPGNLSDALYKAARRNLVTEVDNEAGNVKDGRQKVWRVTRTGINHVQSLRKEAKDE